MVVYWQEVAKTLKQRWEENGYKVAWIGEGATGKSIDQHVQGKSESSLFGLRFVPPSFALVKGHPVIDAVRKGSPFVVWFARDPGDWNYAVARLERLFGGSQGLGIFRALRELRVESPEASSHGSLLKVLWDDPARYPCQTMTYPAVGSDV